MLNAFAAPSGVFRLTPQLKKTVLKKLGTVLKSLQSWRGVRNYPFLRYIYKSRDLQSRGEPYLLINGSKRVEPLCEMRRNQYRKAPIFRTPPLISEKSPGFSTFLATGKLMAKYKILKLIN